MLILFSIFHILNFSYNLLVNLFSQLLQMTNTKFLQFVVYSHIFYFLKITIVSSNNTNYVKSYHRIINWSFNIEQKRIKNIKDIFFLDPAHLIAREQPDRR